MGVLDDAAEELVKKIAPFAGLLSEAKERFDELDGAIDDLKEGIEAEWEALEQKANAFIALVEDEREKLENKCDEGGKALQELKGAVGTAQSELEDEMDGAQAELKALTDAVAPLDDEVESMVAGYAEGPSEALVTQAEALVRDINGAVRDTQMHLETAVTRGLQSVSMVVDAWVADVLKAGTESQARLDRAYEEWSVKLAEGGDLVAKGVFASTRANLELTVDHAIEECDQAHDAKMDELQEAIDALKQQLDQLETAMEQAEKTVETSGNSLEAGLKELKSEVLGAQKELDRMEKFLGRYTFTQ